MPFNEDNWGVEVDVGMNTPSKLDASGVVTVTKGSQGGKIGAVRTQSGTLGRALQEQDTQKYGATIDIYDPELAAFLGSNL
jgi:hypothetical protein